MAQIPNYYYNSPYIADAARSLASAFAPADPLKQIEAQRENWKFKQMQEMARIAAEDRADTQTREHSLANMLTPVYDPVTGEVDEKATSKKLYENWSSAIEHGAKPAEGASLAGLLDPKVAVSMALADRKASGLLNAIDRRYGYIGENLQTTEGGKDRRQASAQAFTLDRDNKNYKYRLGLQADRIEGLIRAKREAAKLPGGKPPRMLSRAALEDIIYAFDLKEEELPDGRKIPKKYKDKLVQDAEELVQGGGKIQTAVNKVWSDRGLDDVAEVKRKSFMGVNYVDDDDLTPVIPQGYDEAPAAAAPTPPPAAPVTPGSLGAAATGADVAPSTPTNNKNGSVGLEKGSDGKFHYAPKTAEEYNSIPDGEPYIVPAGPNKGAIWTKGANGR